MKFLQVAGLSAEIEGEEGACCCEGSVEYESVYRGVYPLHTRNSWRLDSGAGLVHHSNGIDVPHALIVICVEETIAC